LSLSTRIDSALRPSIRREFPLPGFEMPAKNRQEKTKKACQNFLHPINPGATTHNPEKVLTR
jgi:hypothetical protein